MSLSIIIPCKNESLNINNVNKILKKKITNIDYEIIFINDFSEDNTKNLLINLSKKDKRIKFFDNKKKGLGGAINLGISKVKNKYIVIMMADLIKAFWEYFNKPCRESNAYNIGGSRYSNCSIIEAINLVKKKLNINIKIKVSKTPRTGDHQWYISNINKFTTDYPNFKIKYNTEKIVEELI
jgi:glycosyltransferase involved in cell wall biosynthesis